MTTERPVRFPITIDVSSECLGTKQCVMTAPELFEINDEDQSQPTRTINDAADLERALIAERSCPTQAITVSTSE